jgi:hypothetical protein
VSSSPPTHEVEIAFLNWVFTKGHVLLDNHGFGNLPEFERIAHARFINGLQDGRPAPETYTLPKEPGFISGPLPYVLGFLILLSLFMYFSLRIRNRSQKGVTDQGFVIPALAFNEDQVKVTPGLYYDKTHTWAYMEKDGTVKAGKLGLPPCTDSEMNSTV